MAVIETDIKQIKSSVNKLAMVVEKSNDSMHSQFDDIKKVIENRNERNIELFSGKWVERSFVWVLRVAGGAVVLALLTLVIINPL